MAGDLDLAEALIGPQIAGPIALSAPVPVLHEYGPNIRIALSSAALPQSPISEEILPEQERLGLQAFRLRLAEQYRIQKAARPFAASSWGGHSGQPTLHRDQQAIVPAAAAAGGAPLMADAPEAKRLTGRVAVGIIIVSGPGGLTMTADQQRTIVAEVQNGLSFLGGRAPARDVTFVYDIQIAQIATSDTTQAPNSHNSIAAYDHHEVPWRDAALAAIGHPGGLTGINQYIRSIKAGKNAQAAYCAFFTHYTLYHFAYCRGPYLVMHYANGGWGTNNLDRVFAHETGHIFGAPDEYAESQCNCAGSHGFYGRPNLNCENCADNGGVSCIMRRNTWDMCDETPYHLGYTMPTV